jgi:hypothetical protein
MAWKGGAVDSVLDQRLLEKVSVILQAYSIQNEW